VVAVSFQTRKVALPSFVNRVKIRSVIGGTAHKRPMMLNSQRRIKNRVDERKLKSLLEMS
jgi:hypothetical protein